MAGHPTTWLLLIYMVPMRYTAGRSDTVHLQPHLNGAGVIFQPHATFQLTSTAWTLVAGMNITSFALDLQTIKDAYHQEHELVQKVIPRNNYGVIKATVTHALQQAEAEFQHLQFRLNGTLLNNPPVKHSKRSLFPSIGYAINFIAGTATDDDVTKVQEQVNELFQRQDKLVSLQSHQLTAFRLLENQVTHQETMLNQQVNLTITMFETLREYVLKNQQQLQPSMHLMWQRDLLATINFFRGTVINLKRIMDSLQSGYLPADLMPPESLFEALQHIRHNLPAHLQLALPLTDRGILHYYQLQLVKQVPHADRIQGLLTIPLTHAEDSFQLYSAIPFPHHLPNNTERFILQQPGSLMAVSSDRSRFLLPGPMFTTHQCIQSSPLICPASMMLRNEHSQNCLFQIFTGRLGPSDNQHTCKFTSFQHDGIELETITDQLWALSTQHPTMLESSCLNSDYPAGPLQPQPDISTIGDHLLHIPQHCTATIGTRKIPLRMDFQSPAVDAMLRPILRSFDTALLLNHYNWSAENPHLAQHLTTASLMLHQMQSSGNSTARLHLIHNMLGQLTDDTADVLYYQPTTHIHLIYGTLWFLLSLGILATILIYCYKTRCQQRRLPHHHAPIYYSAAPVDTTVTDDSIGQIEIGKPLWKNV